MTDWEAKLLLVLSAKRVANRLHVRTMGRPDQKGKKPPYRAVKRLVNKIAPKRGEKPDPDGDGERLW